MQKPINLLFKFLLETSREYQISEGPSILVYYNGNYYNPKVLNNIMRGKDIDDYMQNPSWDKFKAYGFGAGGNTSRVSASDSVIKYLISEIYNSGEKRLPVLAEVFLFLIIRNDNV